MASGQTVEETYPQTLWSQNDTFIMKHKGLSTPFYFTASRKDNRSPGTDAAIDEYATIYYGHDSLRLNYNNRIPYAHIIYLHFASPKGKTTFRFHFNEVAGYFPDDYIKKNSNNVQYDIPEPYELANIIWTLSPSGERAQDLNKASDYYKQVVAYFKPYKNHPIFKKLDFPDSLYAVKYYDFRENSFAFNMKDTVPGSKNMQLLFNGPYYYVNGDALADSSLFGNLKPLVEDFAAKSNFRQFYKSHLSYYRKELQRQKELLPVKQMWHWLEDQFPATQYNSYRIVSSPLIGGSHSTQNYASPYNGKWFSESVMFICGTDRYDKVPELTEKQKEGLMSGIVFTEIDHNYINRISSKYANQIDSIFGHRSVWAKSGNSSEFYYSAMSVFNEYMTHAVFCLYILDNYDKQTADLVIDKREDLMVNRRNFIRFKEFDSALIKLRQENKAVKVVDLYTAILQWCAKQL
ncbi:DUF4932 domain-containing protein [Deminuibacter soli]|nr:DUF4932 domain-containing protein [Deminuibacter soli]